MRALLLVLVACLLLASAAIFLFYAEEDARGARAWHDTEAWLQSRGEPLHWTDLIPPSIPDNQNLGALPLFQTEPDPKNPGKQISVLHRAFANLSYPYTIPKTGNWQLGQHPDLPAIQKNLADRYQEIFHPTPGQPPLSALAQLDALCPALDEIRSAAAQRPLCRLPQDYTSQPPYQRLLDPTTGLLRVAQAFNLHAVLALHAGLPDLALADIEISLKIDSGLRQEPLLVAGLVAAAPLAIQMSSIWEGLQLHTWNDAQLERLQGDLTGIDFLSDEQLCLRGEALLYHNQTDDWMRDHRLQAAKILLGNTSSLMPNPFVTPPWLGRLLIWLVPRGWFDLEKSFASRIFFEAAEKEVNPTASRVFPKESDHFEVQIENLNPYAPWNVISRVSLQPVLQCSLPFAVAQFHTDSARIACILERYHLAHGTYPTSLDDLRPYDPAGPPHDIMNGQPYHYTLHPDGTYLLYSVGWNQTDDGGKPAYLPGSFKALDREHGDWVWPNPAK